MVAMDSALEKGHCIPECLPRTAAQGISSTATPFFFFCCLSLVELCFPDVCAIFPLTLVDFLHSHPPSARSLPWILYCPGGISSSSFCFTWLPNLHLVALSPVLEDSEQLLTLVSPSDPAGLSAIPCRAVSFSCTYKSEQKAQRQNVPVFQISSCSEGTQGEWLEAESGARYFGIFCCLAQWSHSTGHHRQLLALCMPGMLHAQNNSFAV